MRGRPAAAQVVGLMVGTTLAVAIAGSASAGVNGVGPPLPPQPGVAAPMSCPPSTAPGGMWGVAHREYDTAYELRVDPWTPCHQYLAHDAQSLDRSVDGGRIWTRVFHDDLAVACTETVVGCTGAFQASGLVVPASGTVALTETGNGDGLVVSQDAGAQWSLANGGVTGLQGRHVQRIEYAPDDRRVIYALVATPGAVTDLVEVSRDAGQTWTPTASPPLAVGVQATSVFVAVDPTDASRFWVLTADAAGNEVLLEASGYGSAWMPPTVVPRSNGYAPTSFSVLSTPRHPLRLLMTLTLTLASSLTTPPFQVNLRYSDNDGVAWANAPVDADVEGLALAGDPVAPDDLVYVGVHVITHPVLALTLRTVVSTDGFDTATPLPDPFTTSFGVVQSPYPGGGVVRLEGDAAGVFHLVTEQPCGAVGGVACPRGRSTAQSEYEIHAVATGPATGTAGGATPGIGVGSVPTELAGVPPPGTIPMTMAGRCLLPLTPGQSAMGVANYAGAIAFDGRDILYTDWEDRGPQVYEGVIHKLDPRTCTTSGLIVVRFRPADVHTAYDTCGALPSNGPRPDYLHPHVDDLTYDARRNVIWATIAPEDFGNPTSCIFRINVTGLDTRVGLGTASLGPPRGCGAGLLSYDQFDDGIWTCPGTAGGTAGGGELDVSTGREINSCDPTATGDVTASGGGVSTWMTGGPHRLYVEYEDDKTLAEFDTVSCRVLVTYQHAIFSEAFGEEEQGACDGSTFGVDQPPVLWLRDAESRTAVAYTIPGGYCPLYTSTAYSGPPTVHQGTTASLCGHLTLLGRSVSLPKLPLTFTVGGTMIGSGVTGPDGTACVPLTATMAVRRYPVEVYFSGDSAYYGSRAAGLLDVLGSLPGASAGTVAAGALLGSGGGTGSAEPNPLQAPSNAGQIQPEPPPQPQPLSQAQTAAQGQPMGAMQADREAQVAPVAALEPASLPDQVGQSYQMSVVTVLATAGGLGALIVVGIGWVLREATPVWARRPASASTSRRSVRRQGPGGFLW